MQANSDQLAGDVPFGVIGKLLGLRIVPPQTESGELVAWSARANMVQRRVRAVGGRLYLTDRRLVFGRSRTESFLGGKESSANLGDLASASAGGKRTIRVECEDGRVERFVIDSADHSARVIDKAIRSTRPTDSEL
jgi:hypothetical protein